MKIGIFIGCFNPVHIAHISCAEELINQKRLDKVIFVPVGDLYQKQGLVNSRFRLSMLSAAINGNPNFEISDIEIKNGKLFTFQTLDYFAHRLRDDSIELILGTDNLKDIKNWKNSDFILQNFRILVLTRDNLDAADFPEYQGRENIVFIRSNKPVSSTKIRGLIAAKNYDEASKFLQPEVLKIIKENSLFEA